MIRTQFFEIKAEKASLTSDVKGNVMLEQVDGEFSTLTFTLTNGYMWLNTLGVGNRITFRGGISKTDITREFFGFIQNIKPTFMVDGTVNLLVECFPFGKTGSANTERNISYPMKNSPKQWAKAETLSISTIIEKLAEDNGYSIGEMSPAPKKDITLSYKSALSQDNRTDWGFMIFLARKIECVLWEEEIDGRPTLFCKDEGSLANTLSNVTLYYVAKVGNTYSVTSANDQMIRMKKLSINLDTDKGKANAKIITKTDPSTGKSQIATETLDPKTGEWTTYILDEEALRNEPPKKRDEIQKLIEDNRFQLDDWSVLKKYFKATATENSASREAVATNYTFENNDGSETETPEPPKQYSFDQEALKSESPEKRAEVLGKSSRGELSDEEFNKYFKEKESTEKSPTIDKKAPKKNEGVKSKGKVGREVKTRRDAGFKIIATCDGDPRVVPKRSYVLEGIAKYSGAYYLYRIKDVWGLNSYEMYLTFTK